MLYRGKKDLRMVESDTWESDFNCLENGGFLITDFYLNEIRLEEYIKTSLN
jgi:hypothetical protein